MDGGQIIDGTNLKAGNQISVLGEIRPLDLAFGRIGSFGGLSFIQPREQHEHDKASHSGHRSQATDDFQRNFQTLLAASGRGGLGGRCDADRAHAFHLGQLHPIGQAIVPRVVGGKQRARCKVRVDVFEGVGAVTFSAAINMNLHTLRVSSSPKRWGVDGHNRQRPRHVNACEAL